MLRVYSWGGKGRDSGGGAGVEESGWEWERSLVLGTVPGVSRIDVSDTVFPLVCGLKW